MNVSTEVHPILKSIRILPKFNPRISYACLTAVYNSTNFLLPTDVKAFLSRCKEIIRSSYQAPLSYYQNARDRCNDENLVTNVIEAQETSVRSPRAPREPALTPIHTSPFSLRNGFRSLFLSPRSHHHIRSSKSEPNLHISEKPSATSLPSPVASASRETSPMSPFHVHSTGGIERPRKSSTCSLRFQEQINTSLFNLSRVITLAGLQFQTVLQSEHNDVIILIINNH